MFTLTSVNQYTGDNDRTTRPDDFRLPGYARNGTPMTDPTTYCLWNSNATEAFVRAMRQRVTVRINCCLWHEGKLTDIVMHGRLRRVEGREVLFVPRQTKILQGKSKINENTCDFFFSLEQREGAGINRMGYQGPGIVLEEMKEEKGEIRSLLLRLARNCSVRKMRRHKRILWTDERSRLAGLVALDTPLNTRTELKHLLGKYYASDQPKPLPVANLSAGGACVCLPEEFASIYLASIYLFFIVPNKAPDPEPPYIFLAKKMGTCKSLCEQGTALRLLFTEELEWFAQGQNLKWENILSTGSARLQSCLDLYDEPTEEDNESPPLLTA